MASSAASSSVSPAASSFGRLLKNSKVISQFDPSIALVYTSYGGSKKRSDYGLKRALPKIKTPAIRVHSIDSSLTKLTDFDYAAKEYTFVNRIKESNVKISGPSTARSAEGARLRMSAVGHAPGGSAWHKNSFESIKDLKERVRTGKTKAERKQSLEELFSRRSTVVNALTSSGNVDSDSHLAESSSSTSSQQPSTSVNGDSEGTGILDISTASEEKLPSFPPDYLSMSPLKFEQFIQDLQTLRPAFLEYIGTRLELGAKGTPFLWSVLNSARTKQPNVIGTLVDDFLAQHMPSPSATTDSSKNRHDPSYDRIEANEHIAFGLTYAPPNLYMSDQATRPLPARVLDSMPENMKSNSFEVSDADAKGQPTAFLGTITATRDLNNCTTWHLDNQGNMNIKYGADTVRVERAQIMHPANIGKAPTVDEILHGIDVDQVGNRSKQPSILDQGTFRAKIYKHGEHSGSLKQLRIGSQEWVKDDRQEARSKRSVDSIFRSDYEKQNLRPPVYGKYVSSKPPPGRARPNSTEKSSRGGNDAVASLLGEFALDTGGAASFQG